MPERLQSTTRRRNSTPAGDRLTVHATAPFAMEALGHPCRTRGLAACRQAGFEPDLRYSTTDLQIQLHLVREQLAVALLPRLASAEGQTGVRTHPLLNRPHRTVFTSVRVGASGHPGIRALAGALAEQASPNNGDVSDAGAPC